MKDMEALINGDATGKKPLRKQRSSNKTNENEVENQSDNTEGLKERNMNNNIIIIENSLQLGCSFKGESMKDTMELYRKLNRNVQQSF